MGSTCTLTQGDTVKNPILNGIFRREVEVVVIPAPGIESCPAVWAYVAAIHVLLNRQFMAAGTAQDGVDVPVGAGPHLDQVISEGFVAVLAGVIVATAGHLDGDDVERRMIVDASGLRIDLYAMHLVFHRRHLSIKTYPLHGICGVWTGARLRGLRGLLICAENLKLAEESPLRGWTMYVSSVRHFATCVALALSFARVASAAEILIGDAKSQPESLTVAPGGVLIVGSASSPFVYKVRPGASTAEKFIDVSTEGPGTFFFGMLADAASNTLWTCQLTPVPNTTPAQRHTALRGFDLTTGAPKIRWNLPGDNTTCNDFAIGPDKALYITDTAVGRIYRLPAGASAAELYLEHRTLTGVDGITFLDGVLYVNNVVFNKLYRIPVDAAGKPGNPVDIWMDQPVKGPDGMRAANGKIFIAENGGGKILALTVNGEKASVTVIKEGLKTPTGVEPVGDTLWFTERGVGKAESVPMPK